MTTNQQAKPFIKWAGGKKQLLPQIRAKYPPELGKTINKYAEPFVGGGAVLFDVLNNYDLQEIYISDINRELIHAYKTVRDNVDALITALARINQTYNSPDFNQSEIYYNARNRFNSLKLADNTDLEIALLFIFLNRTCFNGLYRVNSKNQFNVPMGRYANPKICDEDNLRIVSSKLQNTQIICGDYSLSRDFIDDKTFVYLDPPYRPLTETSKFNSYSKKDFNDRSQRKLAKFINEIADKGAYFITNNSDPKNADPNDDFFDKLYAKHDISRVQINRMIEATKDKRKKINELIISSKI